MKSVTFENLKKQNYTMKESLRALKTNIQFCGDDICTIVVTSAMPNEGKSTVTMDLARSFSESGKRVLLIDTDMRKSVYVGRLRAVASDGREIYGLSHFLSGLADPSKKAGLTKKSKCFPALYKSIPVFRALDA